MAGKGSGEQVIREMKKRGLTPNVGLLCETPQAIITAVAKQMGVGVLFEEMVTPEIKSGKFRMLELPSGDFGGESIVIYRKDRPLTPDAVDFLKLLRQEQQKHGR